MALEPADIQGNLLRGYRAAAARHVALAVTDRSAAAGFLAGLISGEEARGPQVTTAEHWDGGKPGYCLNVGVTFAGLTALGVPKHVLDDFPLAFQQGAAARAAAPDPDFPDHGVGLGDVGGSAPEHWILGGPGDPEVHLMLSLYVHEPAELEPVGARLEERFAGGGMRKLSTHDAAALPENRVHFGYRDGIAQPQIAGGKAREIPDMQPPAPTGDFLLGRDHVNSFGGNYIGSLLPALGDNASYAAFRILRQDVAAFERLLAGWAATWQLDPELIAAKLLGRWRDGAPLSIYPDGDPTVVDEARLNEFDYAPGAEHPTYFDDLDGRRCPVGAHIRRLNPRGSLVMGLPHSRRLVRRGMPYGPAYDPAHPDETERGLVGMFVCGDLELQYEFILRVWANQDLATHGLRGTRDPLIGAQPEHGGKFVLRTDDDRDPIVLTGLPNLATTRGSVYCLVPGIGGLRYLSSLPQPPAP